MSLDASLNQTGAITININNRIVTHSYVRAMKLKIWVWGTPTACYCITHPCLKAAPPRLLVLLTELPLITVAVRLPGHLPTVHGKAEGVMVAPGNNVAVLVRHPEIIKVNVHVLAV